MEIKIDSQELGTILAALRLWEWANENGSQQIMTVDKCGERFEAIEDIATNCGKFDRLDLDEIDELCMRLNCGEDDDAKVGK